MKMKLARIAAKKGFSWGYDYDEGMWCLYNDRKQTVIKRKESWEIISNLLAELKLRGITGLLDYWERKMKTKNRVEYHKNKNKSK